MTGGEAPQAVTLYGHRVELERPASGYVVDVLVLARSVVLDEDGDPEDALTISTSAGVTGLVGTGITTAAADIYRRDWAREDDEE